MLFSGVSGYDHIAGIIYALIYLVLFPGIAFLTWHMALYRALRYDSAFWHILFFITFGLQIGLWGFLAIGMFNGGGGGLIGMIEMMGHGAWLAGIACLCCTVFLVGSMIWGLALLKNVISNFRGAGHSLQRAGAEAGRTAARNQTVRTTAREAVLNAV